MYELLFKDDIVLTIFKISVFGCENYSRIDFFQYKYSYKNVRGK